LFCTAISSGHRYFYCIRSCSKSEVPRYVEHVILVMITVTMTHLLTLPSKRRWHVSCRVARAGEKCGPGAPKPTLVRLARTRSPALSPLPRPASSHLTLGRDVSSRLKSALRRRICPVIVSLRLTRIQASPCLVIISYFPLERD
jgi:hypothetical protein